MTPVGYLPRFFGPGGNINSTVHDVLQMAHLFLSGGEAQNGAQIVSTESIRQMMRPEVSIPDPYSFGYAYGLGLMLFNWHGQQVYGHDGNTIGQGAYLRILPNVQLEFRGVFSRLLQVVHDDEVLTAHDLVIVTTDCVHE